MNLSSANLLRPVGLVLALLMALLSSCTSDLGERFAPTEVREGDRDDVENDDIADDGPSMGRDSGGAFADAAASDDTATDDDPIQQSDDHSSPNDAGETDDESDLDDLIADDLITDDGTTDDLITDDGTTDDLITDGGIADDVVPDDSSDDVEPMDAGPNLDAGSTQDAGDVAAEGGQLDPNDECPDDPDKLEPMTCGCGTPETDSDSDSIPDCTDACDNDPTKTSPEECGCGVPEQTGDADNDEVIDCLDGCPDDPEKTQPGVCGCGVEEVLEDADDDGTPACLDECDDDPSKTLAGGCGCGMPDTEGSGEALLCETLSAALIHRYTFNGPASAVAIDSVGTADGIIVGTQTGADVVVLAGGSSDQYIELPGSVLSGVIDLTVEAWVTWDGGGPWQRIFDFGSSDAGAGNQGQGLGGLFLTPMTGISGAGFRAAFNPTDEPEVDVTIGASLATNGSSHVAVVFDDSGNRLAMFLNGQQQGNTPMDYSLSDAPLVNHWLGRSQFVGDEGFDGTLHEVRIYSSALGADAMEYSFEVGRDAVFPE